MKNLFGLHFTFLIKYDKVKEEFLIILFNINKFAF